MRGSRIGRSLLLSLCLLIAGAPESRAQITTDGSVGPVVSLPGLDVDIPADLGEYHGSNLFHSFEEFNVQTGGSATFTPGSLIDSRGMALGPVDNLIARVTGGQISHIDGVLGSTLGETSFYFLNPAGTMVGSGGSLALPGSLHLTSADGLNLTGGALPTTAQPLDPVLAATSPESFGFLGPNAGALSVDGGTLAVADFNTLSLIGGPITLMNGAILSAPTGRINLASVTGSGDVVPDTLLPGAFPDPAAEALAMNSFSNLGAITIDGASQVTVEEMPAFALYDRTGPAGAIVIRSGDVNVLGGSSLSAIGGTQSALRGVDLEASRTVSVAGGSTIRSGTGEIRFALNSLAVGQGSGIGTLIGSSPTGDYHQLGAVSITADNLITITQSLSESDDIYSFFRTLEGIFSVALAPSSAKSAVGLVSIHSPAIVLDHASVFSFDGGGSFGSLDPDTGLFTSRVAAPVSIAADYTELRNGSSIWTDHGVDLFDGTSAPITISGLQAEKAASVRISGGSEIISKIGSAGGAGEAGKVTIRADQLQMDDGKIVTSGLGDKPSGDIILELGGLTMENGSLIDNGAEDATGEPLPQRLVVSAPGGVVEIREGSKIASNSLNHVDSNRGGTIDIEAKVLRIDGGAIENSLLGAFGIGQPGEIIIRVGVLILENGGRISRQLAGFAHSAPAISVTIEAADSVLVTGAGSRISTKSMDTTRGGVGSGAILIRSPYVTISQGAVVEADGVGIDAGSIVIDTREIRVASGAQVSSTSQNFLQDFGPVLRGAAGSITIGPENGGFQTDSVVLSDATISTFADEGPDAEPREGNITINASGLVLLDNGQITSSVGTGLGGSIAIGDPGVAIPEALVLRNGSTMLARTDNGTGGSIDIAAGVVLTPPFLPDFINADAGVGSSGSVNISASARIEADSIAPLDAGFLDASRLMRPSCAARSASREGEGSLSVARRRGLPVTPEQWLLAFDEVATPEAVAGDDEALPPVAAAPPVSESIQVAMLSPDTATRGDALRGIAQDQQRHGLYADSVATLEAALALAEQSGDAARTASALGNLGNAHLALGNQQKADALLTRGIGLAQEAERPDLAATLYNNLGNQQAMLARQREAMASYEASARLAREAGDELREAQALANAARAALEAAETSEALRLLAAAHETAKDLDPSFGTASVLIHLARTDAQLAETSSAQRRSSLLRAHRALHRAQAMARTIDDDRTLAYALGNLGALYEGEHRTDEALFLTRQALRAAERGEAFESLYRWHWQEGRLLWAKGDTSEAIASYRRAVALLEEARQESLAQYGSASLYFRRAVAPVYLALVDALLQTAGRVESIQAQPLLLEARQTTDLLKAAELRDYFRDECVADLEAKTIHPEDVPGRAAVVYPILLPDRTELLVHLPEGLARFTVEVPGDAVRALAGRFRSEFASPASDRYRAVSQQLYDALVRPYAQALEDQQVTTLVFIPDVALRTIPMAALHDGAQFLVERYALAVTPGLSLVDPKPLDIGGAELLLAGASDFSDIPDLPEGFEKDIADLPMVPRELAAIRDLYGGEVLLDAAFERERLAQEVVAGSPSVVHLASHAVFTGDPETSFLLTHDGPLTLERMSQVVGRTRFRSQRPLELLVLSACETAAGDARAGLGLAGVAVRSGARSVVGSLWSIPDQAAYELVLAFYRALGEPGVSRAAALQQAQRQLLADARFDHPYYWSPYLLVSNWL